MTFSEFIEEVEAYVRLENNTTIRPVLKTLINDSIVEFCRFWEWRYLEKVFEFTTGKTFDITAASDTEGNFGIAGNQVFKFKAGDTITVSGSTSNDGDYTVLSTPSFDGTTTTIAVAETVTDDTADGTLTSETEDYGVPTYFVSERNLYTDGGALIEKRSYQEFLECSTGYFSMLGNRFYLTGSDTSYKLIYTWKDKTLVNDADESEVLDFYSDIIKQWTLVKFLVWYGDRESAAEEKQLLQLDLDLLKKNEERSKKKGRPVRISSHNRR